MTLLQETTTDNAPTKYGLSELKTEKRQLAEQAKDTRRRIRNLKTKIRDLKKSERTHSSRLRSASTNMFSKLPLEISPQFSAVPFKAEHVYEIEPQDAQANVPPMSLEQLHALEGAYAVTLLEGGKPLICCGAAEVWNGRALVWSLLDSRVDAKLFPKIFTLARAFIESLPFNRLEATVECNFENGHRLVRALGFDCQAPVMEDFYAGRSHALYARVKGK